MISSDNATNYRSWVRHLMATHPLDEAMSLAVGGDYHAVGAKLLQIVQAYGLEPRHHVIDAGCGSGRLAVQLDGYLAADARYLGTDIVQELLTYAMLNTRSDWRFELCERPEIPAAEASADWVYFFSVFTHLLHHESYCFLEESQRVLKPGGRVLFSFLELPDNWAVFEQTCQVYKEGAGMGHLNQCMDRQSIACWADKLGMDILHIQSGFENYTNPANGLTAPALGQALCLMQKR